VIRRTSKLLIEVIAGLGAGLAVVLALLAGRLSSGPVSLDFLTPYMQEAIVSEDDSFRVVWGNLFLAWAGWERTLDIRAKDARLFGPGGELLVGVPELGVSLSGRALLRGRVALSGIDVFEPRIHLVRRAEGGFSFVPEAAPGEEGEESSAAMFVETILDRLATPGEGDALGYLKRISVLGAELVIEDRQTGVSWFAPQADVVILRKEDQLLGNLSLDIQTESGLAHFNATSEYRIGERRFDLGARFADLDPPSFIAGLPELEALAGLRIPLSGEVEAGVTLAGEFEQVSFDVSGGRGQLEIPEVFSQPLEIQGLTARGQYAPADRRLVVEHLGVDFGHAFGGPSLTASGTLVERGETPAIEAEVAVSDMPTSELDRYWPKPLSPNTRGWVLENLEDGTIHEATARLSGRIGAEGRALAIDSAAGALRFSGITVHYLSPMPPATQVNGTARFDEKVFDATAQSGELGKLRMGKGTVHIVGLDEVDQVATIRVPVKGPVFDTLVLLNHPRLGYLDKLGLDAAGATGSAAGDLVFTIPLESDLALDEIGVNVHADLSGFGLPRVLFGQPIDKGDFRLFLTVKGMEVEGTARFSGVPVALTWKEAFTDSSPLRSRYTIRGRFGEAKRAELGFDYAPVLRGPVDADLIYTIFDGGKSDVAAVLDLGGSTLDLSALGWTKPAGVTGAARLSVSLENDRWREIRDFTITAGDLSARGRATFSEDGSRLARVRFDRLRFGRNDATVNIFARADGAYDIDAQGASFDAAPLLERGEGEGKEEEATLPPLVISGNFGRLWMSESGWVEDAAGALRFERGEWRSAVLDAKLSEGGRLSLRIVPHKEEKRRKLTVTSDNAGALLKTIEVYDNVEGGVLEINGYYDDAKAGAPLAGEMRMTNYRVMRAPVLAQLLAIASLTGILDVLQGEGMVFKRLDAPFERVGDELFVREAKAYGFSLGLTVEGTLHLDSNTADLEGTLVPAYTINQVLGDIPVLGSLLIGGEGEGVFAITYRIEGSLDQPKVVVHPLTALAPGFLRNMLSGILELGKISGGGKEKPREPAPERP
jgi:hypothetical protein